jgi:hypothetical protein
MNCSLTSVALLILPAIASLLAAADSACLGFPVQPLQFAFCGGHFGLGAVLTAFVLRRPNKVRARFQKIISLTSY